MAAYLILVLVAAYVLWALRRIVRRRRVARGRCCGCPYHAQGLCRRADWQKK